MDVFYPSLGPKLRIDSIRDSAGPEPIGAGTRVLPHEDEDNRQGPQQDVAGRELWTEDGRRATYRPIPPLPKSQPGTNTPSQKVKVPVSNLTKKQWFKLDDDAKALEKVWVKEGSNIHKLAMEEKLENQPEKVYKTYEDALKRLLESANLLHGEDSVTKESAKIILKRGLKPSTCGSGFVFTRDLRLVTRNLHGLSFDFLVEFAKKIQCPHLLIKVF